MKIKLVTVGKLKEKYLKEGIAEYSKRLSRFTKVEIIELADEKTPDKARTYGGHVLWLLPAFADISSGLSCQTKWYHRPAAS